MIKKIFIEKENNIGKKYGSTLIKQELQRKNEKGDIKYFIFLIL